MQNKESGSRHERSLENCRLKKRILQTCRENRIVLKSPDRKDSYLRCDFLSQVSE